MKTEHETMKLLTVKEVSEILKAKPSTIYLWAEQGIIPCYKLNGLLRFDETEVIQWIKSCKNNPTGQYNIPAGRRPRKGG
jgi:excisionase family DNA binding protein